MEHHHFYHGFYYGFSYHLVLAMLEHPGYTEHQSCSGLGFPNPSPLRAACAAGAVRDLGIIRFTS